MSKILLRGKRCSAMRVFSPFLVALLITACDSDITASSSGLVPSDGIEGTKEALIANPDSGTVEPGGSVAISVLNNDEGDIAEALIETNVNRDSTRGWIRINQSAGTITYTPYTGQSGRDSFGYRLRVPGFGVSDPTDVVVDIRSDSSTAPTIPPGNPDDDETTSANGLTVAHRNGQTFITWEETGQNDSYQVYRHTSPISASNLVSAKKLTSRWGPLGSDTSVNKYGTPGAPGNFVIEDLGSPLSDNTGLFVYTTQQSDSSVAYYAVTTVRSGVEILSELKSLTSSITETVRPPRDVLTRSVNGGKGRIYTQYMDYSKWNPTLNGYAYNYSVALPASYDSNQPYSLQIQLHAYGETAKSPSTTEYDWQVIQLFPHDPGAKQGTINSWWYGYAQDHDYRNGDKPTSGRIENFTEQRVMRSVQELILNPDFNVDEELIHAYGNSMGASGSLALGIRYGSVLTGIFASQPMTDYANSSRFVGELERLWGSRGTNLRIINDGPYSLPIQTYNNLGVWEWMDHHQQLQNRRGDTFAYLMTTHGKRDTVIDWQSQGWPTVQAFTDANVGFSAAYSTATHSWTGFTSVVRSLFGFDGASSLRFKYPLSLSYPSITRASGSSSVTPSASALDTYNLNIEWATPHTPFDSNIVDQANRYEITIRSTASSQTANITPRRTRSFRVNALQACNWTATNRNSNQQISSGRVVADLDSLVTVNSFPIITGKGTRLIIDCS